MKSADAPSLGRRKQVGRINARDRHVVVRDRKRAGVRAEVDVVVAIGRGGERERYRLAAADDRLVPPGNRDRGAGRLAGITTSPGKHLVIVAVRGRAADVVRKGTGGRCAYIGKDSQVQTLSILAASPFRPPGLNVRRAGQAPPVGRIAPIGEVVQAAKGPP